MHEIFCINILYLMVILGIMVKKEKVYLENFIYKNPTKLIFGKDQLHELHKEIPADKKVLLVYGGGSIKRNGLYDQVLSELAQVDVTVFELGGVEPNPRIATVRKGVRICKAREH